MNVTGILLFVLMGLILLAPTIGLTWYYLARVRNKRPSYYGRAVQRILKRYALLRRYQVMQNVHFEVEGKTGEFSHLLAGPFGLLIVTTLDHRGSYFGDAKTPYWIWDNTKTREQIPNPYLKNQKNIELLRRLFAKEEIYSAPVEQLIVYDSYAKKCGCFTGSEVSTVRVSQLSDYLNREKFDRDNGVDAQRICRLFSEK